MSSSIAVPRTSSRIMRSVASAVVVGVGTLSLTGCVGLLPNSNTKAGEKLLNGGHAVVYKVEAPHGSKITYSQGEEQFYDQANNFGTWHTEASIEGIKKLEITVTVEEGQTATCTITVDGVTVSTANNLPGVSNAAHCKGTTTKT